MLNHFFTVYFQLFLMIFLHIDSILNFVIENQVKPRYVVSISCNSNKDCEKDVGIDSKCINKVCKCGPSNETCVHDQIPNVDKVVIMSKLGENCTNNSNCFTQHSKCDQEHNMCVCLENRFPSPYRNRCLLFLDNFLDTCYMSEQCDILIPFSRCLNNSCVCQNGYKYADKNCWLSSGLNHYCFSTHQCSHISNSNCINNKCTCGRHYTSNTDATRCLPIAATLGSPCWGNVECQKGLGIGSHCEQNFCKCSEEYYFNYTEIKCKSNLNIGKYCHSQEDCYHGQYFSDRVLCNKNSTCVCGGKFVESNGIFARTPVLRVPTRSLIASLAVADLLLGFTVIPVSGLREIFGSLKIPHPCICTLWTFLDVFCCTASILSLCGISIDRYIGVSRPLSYSGIVTKRRAKILVFTIWVLAFSISSGQILFLGPMHFDNAQDVTLNDCQVNKNLGYVIFSAMGSFYVPATIIIILYSAVYRAAVKHTNLLNSGERITRNDVLLRVHIANSAQYRQNNGAINKLTNNTQYSNSSTTLPQLTLISNDNGNSRRSTVHLDGSKFKKQKKAAKTLGIVVGCFLLCWFPFFIILIVDAACNTCNFDIFFDIFFWLGYFNSCINPFIYAFTSRDLRKAFLGLLPCKGIYEKRKISLTLSQPSQSPNTAINLVNVYQESTLDCK